jgi:nitrogen fixation protein NifU and related proteins
MPVYNEKVMDHFMNPRNVGEIKDADGVGEEGNPVCGDMMTMYIKVKDDRLEDIKFKTFGCGSAIAVSSIVSEIAKGMTLDEAMKLTPAQVVDELGGLPKQKLHCSNLGAQALHRAIDNYRAKKAAAAGERYNPLAVSEDEHNCPHCNAETDAEGNPVCKTCSTDGQECTTGGQ